MYDPNNTRFAGDNVFTESKVASFIEAITKTTKLFEELGESIKKFSDHYEESPSNKDEKEKEVEIRVLGKEDNYSCVDENMLYIEKYCENDRIFEEVDQKMEGISTNREKRRHTDNKWHDTRYKRKQYDKRYF